MTVTNHQDWVKLQEADPCIKAIKQYIRRGTQTTRQDVLKASAELKVYIRELHKLKLENGVIYRFTTDEKNLKWKQLVVPSSHQARAMSGVHEELCHSDHQTTLKLARQRFFWPFMASMIQRKCKSCERCVRGKAIPEKAPLHSIQTTYPIELLCMDFLSLEPDSSGIKDILVMTDHFTKYVIAKTAKTAKVVAEALLDNIIAHCGWPASLHRQRF